MILNKNINFLIKSKGLSQTFLSKELNISVSLLNNIIKGRSKPSYEVLQKIASFFNISIDVLLNFDIEEAGEEFKKGLDAMELENEKMRKEIAILKEMKEKEIALLRKEIENLKKETYLVKKEMILTLREAGVDYNQLKDEK